MEISFHVMITILILAVVIVVLFRLSDAKNVIFETAGRFLAVFSPVLWGIFFSLLLEPMTAFWQAFYEKRCDLKHHNKIRDRKAGTILSFLSLGLILFLLCGFLAKKIGNVDFIEFVGKITDYVRRIGDILVLLNLKLAEMGLLSNVESVLTFWTEQTVQWVERLLLGFASSIPNIGSSFLDILIGLVAAFYFLMEKQRIFSLSSAFVSVFLGEKWAGYFRDLFYAVYSVFVGYLSGQILDAVIMAILFSAVFLIVGLPHAVFLGLLSGFSNMIPYFGAIVAFILAVFSGLLSGTPIKALYASVLILLLQQVDSIFIIPKAVGKRMELHPVLVLLSLAVFGRWFGFLGLLFAVPLGALCKNGLFWLYERKKEKERI